MMREGKSYIEILKRLGYTGSMLTDNYRINNQIKRLFWGMYDGKEARMFIVFKNIGTEGSA